MLNGALSTITSTASSTFPTVGSIIGGASSSATTTTGTPILDLSVGPVDLNLLGLQVNLDNCWGGPITVDISAIPSAQTGGGLLGDLLIGLDGLLNSATGSTLTSLENTIANDLKTLICSNRQSRLWRRRSP